MSSSNGGNGGNGNGNGSSIGPSHHHHNRYHLQSSGSRTPRVFPPDMNGIPLSPSKLESPMFRERVGTLMQQGDTYAKKLDFERRRSFELDAILHQIRNMHFETRKKLCHTTNSQNCAATTDMKSIRTLENRLDKVLTRYNEVCNANKKLREEIQSLRREKVQQQHIHDKLERETHQKQNEITKVTSATQSAFDARDRANRQTEALRAQIAGEDEEFESGWQEKRMQLEQDRASIRDIPRLRTPKLSPTRQQPAYPFSPHGANAPGGFKLLSTPDVKLRDETLKNVRLITEKENDLRKQSERLKLVEDGLAKIKKKTGAQDADELAQALVTAEEKSFSLFNMINELNTEMEAIEIENNELEQLIDECKGSGVNSDAYRQQLKQHLEDQIEKSKQKVQYFEMRHAESAEAMETMKNGAMSIFHKVGNNEEAFAQQLLSHGITEVNMTKLLGIIERRIGELVDIHNIATNAPASLLKPDTADGAHTRPSRGGISDKRNATPGHAVTFHGNAHGGSAAANAAAALLRPVPPAADEFGDSDNEEPEELVRPCKIAEIQEKTASAVGRRKEKQNRNKR